MQSCLSLLPFN
jgi:hypothetical protein